MEKIRIFIISLAIFLISGFAFADDPGERDSIIVETVFADSGQNMIDVRIYATSDDSVFFYNLPITWYSPDSAIFPSYVTYHGVILYWDAYYDTLIYDQQLVRMVGWCDVAGPENPPLITNNNREHCWTLHFAVDPSAISQFVVIDTTYDPQNGSLLFGLGGGIISFAPVFIPGIIYYDRIHDTTDVSNNELSFPRKIAFLQNYPNPFNASTTIEFTLPEEAEVELSVYNILGQKVATLCDGRKPAGKYVVTWNAGDYPSGVYFARLETKEYSKDIKMVLLK